MSIAKFIEKIEDLRILIAVEEDNLKISAPKGVMNPEIIAELKRYKEELLQWYAPTTKSSIPKASEQESYPVSSDQRRIWLLSQDPEGIKAYVMPINLILEGNVQVEVLQQVFAYLIERHEILRTAIRTNKQNELRQYVLNAAEVAFKMQEVDLSGEDDPTATFREHNLQQLATPFEFASGQLMRVELAKIGPKKYMMAVLLHHIIADGWSLQILTQELISIYASLAGGETVSLSPLKLQYKDFASWQHGISRTSDWKQQEDYWINRFSGEIPVLELPTWKRRPLRKTYSGRRIQHKYPQEFLQKLRIFSQTQKRSLFTTLMAGFKGLMYRYSNQTDLIIGTPMATRGQQELEQQIGLYLNTLAIRTQFKQTDTFAEILTKVHESLMGAYNNSTCPFDHWMQKLNLKVHPDRSVLFDVMVAFQHLPGKTTETTAGLVLSQWEKDWVTCKFDLLIEFFEREQDLTIAVDYNTDIYDADFVQRIIRHFETFMRAILDDPKTKIDQVNYLSTDETSQLIHGFNMTAEPYPRDKNLVELWGEQVIKSPEKTAIVFQDQTLTYQQAEKYANQFAHFLRTEFPVEKEELIAVIQEKSIWTIPLLLGILKAGGAYVPIDINYPEERKNYLKKVTNSRIVADDALLQQFMEVRMNYPATLPEVAIAPEDLVHVMFTSGTTGNPKGVMIEHRNIVRLIKPSNYLPLHAETVLLSTVSISFDTTNMEFWGVLINGGTVILETREGLLDYAHFKQVMVQNKVNTLWLTASWFEHVAETAPALFDGLQWFISGGEVVAPKYTNQLLKRNPSLRIVNGYGPTENTTFSTSFLIDRPYEHALPIGKPLANSTAYVLNDSMLAQPIGVVGTLFVGGDGVARGYYNNADLTNEKFKDDPFQKGQRIYNTGDFARLMPDGNIEFLQRKDHLVKIRGKFIDTTEIENYLGKMEEVGQAVVLVRTIAGEKKIVAYIVFAEVVSFAELKSRLRLTLPEFMVPNAFVAMDRIPLSPNGKTEQRALPEVGEQKDKVQELKTQTEEQLASIWSRVLNVDQVGRTDDFFELGGYSLTCITLTTRIEKEMGKRLSMADLYQHARLCDLAQLLDEKASQNPKDTIEAVEAQTYPLTLTQERMWLDNQLNPGSLTYTMANLFTVRGNDAPRKLEFAFRKLVERHHILRSVFPFEDAAPSQKVLHVEEAFGQIFHHIKWSADIDFDPKRFLEEQQAKAIRLTENCPIRLSLVERSTEEWGLLLQIHHIAYDAWSMKILSEEFRHFLEAEETLNPLRIQFKHFASWQRDALEKGMFEEHLTYWKSHLSELPTPQTTQSLDSSADPSSTLNLRLDAIASEQIKRMCEQEQVEDSYLFLAVFAQAHKQVFGIDDFVCNFPYLGRNNSSLQEVVGLFYQILILRIQQVDTKDNLLDFARALQEQMLTSVEHLDYPFEKLVDEVDGLKAHIKTISFNVVSQGFIGQENGWFERSELQITPLDLGVNKRFRTDLTFDLYKSEVYDFHCTWNVSKYTLHQAESLLDAMYALFRSLDLPQEIPQTQITNEATSETT